MKNYQKLLIPCAAGIILSMSAFIGVDKNELMEKTDELSAVANLTNALGDTAVSTAVTVSTKKNKFSVETVETFDVAESKAALSLLGVAEVNMDDIVKSYR